jgi:hypothetical protein
MAAAAAALASDITGFPVAPSYGVAIVPVEAADAAAALGLAASGCTVTRRPSWTGAAAMRLSPIRRTPERGTAIAA